MRELRHNTEQIISVGVLFKGNPHKPVSGIILNDFQWTYLIKADKTSHNIEENTWVDVPNCDGVYFLTLTILDVDQLGPLVVYIMDEVGVRYPIFMEFNVINQSEYDSKYTDSLLRVVSEHAQKG